MKIGERIGRIVTVDPAEVGRVNLVIFGKVIAFTSTSGRPAVPTLFDPNSLCGSRNSPSVVVPVLPACEAALFVERSCETEVVAARVMYCEISLAP